MPAPQTAPRPFIVEIRPTAWQQIAPLSQDIHLALLARLSTLAELASLGPPSAPVPSQEAPGEPSLSFVVGDLTARYEVESQARSVRLLGIARRASEQDSG